MNRYNDALRRHGRAWFDAVACAGGARQRREAVADWSSANKAARVLDHVGALRRSARGFGRAALAPGTASTWRDQVLRDQRARCMVDARDLLYALRKARRAGVLRVRVPA